MSTIRLLFSSLLLLLFPTTLLLLLDRFPERPVHLRDLVLVELLQQARDKLFGPLRQGNRPLSLLRLCLLRSRQLALLNQFIDRGLALVAGHLQQHPRRALRHLHVGAEQLPPDLLVAVLLHDLIDDLGEDRVAADRLLGHPVLLGEARAGGLHLVTLSTWLPAPPVAAVRPLDGVVLGAPEVAHRLARQVATLPLELEDVLHGRLLVRQLDLSHLHLLAVADAQLAARVAVEDDVVPLPDEHRIAATFGLDAVLQRQQLAFRLQGDQALEGRVDLEGGRISPRPVGSFALVADFTILDRPCFLLCHRSLHSLDAGGVLVRGLPVKMTAEVAAVNPRKTHNPRLDRSTQLPRGHYNGTSMRRPNRPQLAPTAVATS